MQLLKVIGTQAILTVQWVQCLPEYVHVRVCLRMFVQAGNG